MPLTRWSPRLEEASLTQRVVARPATDLESLTTKFSAILWLIEVNGSLLDDGDLQRLRRFGRDVAALADAES